MLLDKIKNFNLILATQSPRRHFLMKEAGFNFEIVVPDGINEIYPDNLTELEIPVYLAELKASWFKDRIGENDLVITADTIVALNDKVLGKPNDYNEAIEMLNLLQGRSHDVVTGVCFCTKQKKKTFSDISKVYFRKLSVDEMKFYVDKYKPYDKAGSYGAQEWIGYIAIERIEGSYFNVMGLPIHKVYEELESFIKSV